jgi:uncharacterized protein YoxC
MSGMETNEIAIISLTVLNAILIFAIVFAVMEVRKAIREWKEVLLLVKGEIGPTLQQLREALESVTAILADARQGVHNTMSLFEVIGNVGDSLKQVEKYIRGSGRNVLANVYGVKAGIKAALGVITGSRTSRTKEKERNGHGNVFR